LAKKACTAAILAQLNIVPTQRRKAAKITAASLALAAAKRNVAAIELS
jgi:hypothetical protein